MLEGYYNFLPRRTTIIHWPARDIAGARKLEDVFIRYRCKDCCFSTLIAGEALHHQKQWHPWWTWWKRLKES